MLYQQQPSSSATDSIAAVAEQLCSREHAIAAADSTAKLGYSYLRSDKQYIPSY
jgi:hypothetical protein